MPSPKSFHPLFLKNKRRAQMRRYALWGLAAGLGLMALIGIIILSGGTAVPGVAALTAVFAASPGLVGGLIPLAFAVVGGFAAALGIVYYFFKETFSVSGNKMPVLSDQIEKNPKSPKHLPLAKHSEQQLTAMARLGRKLTLVKIPYVPPKIDWNDMHKNGKLLTDSEIRLLESLDLPFEKHSKEILQKTPGLERLQFSITRTKAGYFANYKGLKHHKELGEGGFGKAKLLQDVDSGDWYAVKVILHSDPETIVQEINALKVVNYYENSFERDNKNHQHQFVIVMKLAKGLNLYQITRGKKLAPVKWINLAIDCLLAIDAVHQQKLLHRDIKSENLIYDPFHRNLTPIDWGSALAAQGKSLEAMGSLAGTEGFIAPETMHQRIRPLQHYSEKTEVHQLGLTIADFLGFTLLKPSQVSNIEPNGVVTMIRDTNCVLFLANKKIPDMQLRKTIFAWLQKMTDPEPENRPTIRASLAFFENIRETQLDLWSKILSIAYIDAEEYQNADPEQRKAIHAALKSANCIVIVDVARTGKVDYTKIKWDLEQEAFCVGDEVIQTTEENLPRNLRDYTNMRCLHESCIANAFYVSNKAEMSKGKTGTALRKARILPIPVDKTLTADDYSEQMKKALAHSIIIPNHFKTAMKALEKDAEKNADARERIQGLIDSLVLQNKRDEGLSYGEFFLQLEALQKDLQENRSIFLKEASLLEKWLEKSPQEPLTLFPKSKPPRHNPHTHCLRI